MVLRTSVQASLTLILDWDQSILISFLKRSFCPSLQPLLESAGPVLFKCIQAHGRFPFTPDKPSPHIHFDELIRSFAFLTGRDEDIFSYRTEEPSPSNGRSTKCRLNLCFRSLAYPAPPSDPAGTGEDLGEYADILDALDIAQPFSTDSCKACLARKDLEPLVPLLMQPKPEYGWRVSRNEILPLLRLLLAIRRYGKYHATNCSCPSPDSAPQERGEDLQAIEDDLSHLLARAGISDYETLTINDFRNLVEKAPVGKENPSRK